MVMMYMLNNGLAEIDIKYQVIEGEEEALPRIEPSKSFFWHYHYSTRRCVSKLSIQCDYNNMLIMLN